LVKIAAFCGIIYFTVWCLQYFKII
jgi:hypothetical protein